MGFIYLIRNKINGKGYIGQTTWPIEKRWRQHIVDALGEDDKKKSAIHYALEKYGVNNFDFDIIETPDDEDLDDREQYWIKYHHTCIYDEQCNGYNLTWGGGGTRVIDPETIIELWNQGYSEGEIVDKTKHSDIAISSILKMKGISSAQIYNRGRERAAEKYKKIIYHFDLKGNFIKEWDSIVSASLALGINKTNLSTYLSLLYNKEKGRRSCGNFLWTRDKADIQLALDKYNDNKYKKFRPVGQFDLDGNFIKEYPSVTDAQNKTGINRKQISGVCQNKPKYKTAGGFKWKYMDEIEN